MRLVNWKGAGCSGGSAAGLKSTSTGCSSASFCFHSSLRLRPSSLCPLVCIRLNYSHLFTPVSAAPFSFFPACESLDARGANSILNYWDLGNSFILLPSPKHIFEQNPIKPVGFMIPEISFFFFFFGNMYFFLFKAVMETLNVGIVIQILRLLRIICGKRRSYYPVWKFLLVLFFL